MRGALDAALAAVDLCAGRFADEPFIDCTLSFSESMRATSSSISRLVGTPRRVSARETRSSNTCSSLSHDCAACFVMSPAALLTFPIPSPSFSSVAERVRR